MNLRRVGLLIWKEFLQLRRDKMMLPIIIFMPLAQLIMFGYVVSADVRDLPTAIVDLDRTPLSQRVSDSFTGSGYFTAVARPQRESDIRPLMDGNRIQVAVVVPKGFADRVDRGLPADVQVIVDGSDSKTSSIAGGYSQAIVADLSTKLAREAAARAGRRAPGPQAARGGGVSGFGIDARVRVLFNPSLRAANTMVPGMIALVLLISMSALMSQAVVKERERGNLEQLFVTPVRRGEYVLGKVLPYVIVASVQIALIFTVGLLWFRVPFRGSLLVMSAGVLTFMLLAIGQALLISLVSRSRYQATQAVMFIMIPSMMLSGFIWPIESMPRPVQLVSYAIPLRYVLVILRSTFMKGSGFIAMWEQFALMAGISVLVFAVALAGFQKRISD